VGCRAKNKETNKQYPTRKLCYVVGWFACSSINITSGFLLLPELRSVFCFTASDLHKRVELNVDVARE